jgi:putative salt-induced outer membrane protein
MLQPQNTNAARKAAVSGRSRLFALAPTVRFFISVAAVFAVALSARAETILLTLKLRNGDRLTGKFVSSDTNQITIATTWLKELSIPRAQLESVLTNAAPQPMAPGKGMSNAPALAGPGAGGTNAPAGASQAGKTNGPPPLLTTNLRPAMPNMKADGHWHGEIQLGTDLTFSSVSRQLYYGRAKLMYAQTNFKNILDLSGSYGVTDKQVSENRMDGSIKSDYDFAKKFYAYNLAGGGYDQIQLIRSKWEEGPGLGYHVIRSRVQALDAEMGMSYQVRDLDNGGVDRRFYYRLAELYVWKLNNKVSFDEKFEFFPQAENPDEFRFRLEANLHYYLLKYLTLNFTVLDSYDTLPAVGTDRNDLQVRSSIGVKF